MILLLRVLAAIALAAGLQQLGAVNGKKASLLPGWDDPQACEWDILVCADGTWVYPDVALGCAFPACWVKFQEPTPAPTDSLEII